MSEERRNRWAVQDGFLVDNEDAAGDITFLMEKSRWGEKWMDGRTVEFKELQDLSKHVTSLGSFSLKGFVPLSLPSHVGHLVPSSSLEDWISILLYSLCRTNQKDEAINPSYLKMMEYGCTNSRIPSYGTKDLRINGQHLLNLLLKMDVSESVAGQLENVNEDSAEVYSPLYVALYSFVALEKGRYEREEFISKSRGKQFALKGKMMWRADGSSEANEFDMAGIIERIIIKLCLIDCQSKNNRRKPAIPELLELFGGETGKLALLRFCRVMLAVAADMFQVIYSITDEDQSKLRQLFHDEDEFQAFTVEKRVRLRKRLAGFIECIFPVFSYLSFCFNVKGQKLLDFDKIKTLVLKAKYSKRTLFKNMREIVYNVAAGGTRQVDRNVNEYLSPLQRADMMKDLLAGKDFCIRLTDEEFQEKQHNEIIEETIEEYESFQSSMNRGDEENATLTEASALEEGMGRQLSFAGALAWLDMDTTAQNDGQKSGRSNGAGESFESSTGISLAQVERTKLPHKNKDVLEQSINLISFEPMEEANFRVRMSAGDLGSPRVEEPFGSTKLDSFFDVRTPLPDVSSVDFNDSYTCSDSANEYDSTDEYDSTEEPVSAKEDTSAEHDAKKKFYEVINMFGEKIATEPELSLKKYAMEIPKDVERTEWFSFLIFILDELAKRPFKTTKKFYQGFCVDVAIGKIMNCLKKKYPNGNLEEKEVRRIIDEQSLSLPIVCAQGRPAWLKEKARADIRQVSTEKIIGELVPEKVTADEYMSVFSRVCGKKPQKKKDAPSNL